jgi:hypothetical protein
VTASSAVDDELHTILVADDYRTKKVVGVVGDISALLVGLLAFQELRRQVIDQLSDYLVCHLYSRW